MFEGESTFAMEKVIEELPFIGKREHFWGAVRIYTDKSHILNRKVCGSSNLQIGIYDTPYKDITLRIVDRITQKFYVEETTLEDNFDVGNELPSEKIDHSDINHQESHQIDAIRTVLQEIGFRFTQKEVKNDCLQVKPDDEMQNVNSKQCSKSEVEETPSVRNGLDIPWQELHTQKKLIVAVIRKVHPKRLQKYVPQLEVVLLDSWKTSATYITRLVTESATALPRTNYSFRVGDTGILSLATFKDKVDEGSESNSNVEWLKNNVLPKLVKWASEIEADGIKPEPGSLSLMNLQQYNQLYQKLKIKYGQPLVEKWTETTDPQKFVFEDVAIATYLILLWRNERAAKGITDYQSFVDMGCGNGLLVYILSGEGHRGLGIDIKKRHIWDMFPKDVLLLEGVVEPSDENLFPQYDWLIGNHSDELTPWLPVIAAKSKYTTRFFVIPCCAHDFDCKYKRRHTGISQYADYIRYIKEVGNVCGFKMWEDKLRIPSTKRVCLIGQERTYSVDESPRILKAIDDFIQVRNEFNATAAGDRSRKSLYDSDRIGKRSADALWSNNFKAREAVQPVRNCTRLDEDVKHDLLATVVGILLEKKCTVEVDVGCPKTVYWDRGGSINLGDLAKRIGPQQLSALKKECGGLQTLLRNHKHMFSIMEGDVSLQVPVSEWNASVPRDRIKTKPCWFHLNHYQNCPLPSTACIYAHGDGDIRKFNI